MLSLSSVVPTFLHIKMSVKYPHPNRDQTTSIFIIVNKENAIILSFLNQLNNRTRKQTYIKRNGINTLFHSVESRTNVHNQ